MSVFKNLADRTMKKINLVVLYSLTITPISSALAMEVFAHRGLPEKYPEHTTVSLRQALNLNPDLVEPDLVLSKDNEFIVIHDIYLDATSDVAKIFPDKKREDGRYYVADFTVADLNKLSFNHRVQPTTNKPAIASRVPDQKLSMPVLTFSEFIKEVLKHNRHSKKKIGIYPELKAPEFHLKASKPALYLFAQTLNDLKLKNPSLEIIAQCFHAQSLKRLRYMLRKDIKTVQLIADDSWRESSTNYKRLTTHTGIKQLSKYASGVGIWLGHLDLSTSRQDEIIELAKINRLFVHAYTVRSDALPSGISSESELIQILQKKGIDGVFTDHVGKTKDILKLL